MSYMKSFGREVHIVPAIVDRFNMPTPTMTPELKRDLQMLKVIDKVQEEKSRTDRKPPGVGRGRTKHGGAAGD
ncbi:hypothetical protein Bca4012_035828 [Brassica carinata]|uniref:Uncharacterized protein n=1 Tax=Brassica carinata TaxID=52824 RepID=A0A8X7Q545_BRACI|nr:hypothetical protein Bca52824_070237 [Brassica carinata]KAG2326913.1 hypothetical protein Bca52824_009641 [Brassica carinata]